MANFVICLIFNTIVFFYFRKKREGRKRRRGSIIAKGHGEAVTLTSIFRFRLAAFMCKLSIILVCAFVDGVMTVPFLATILIVFLTEILTMTNKTRFIVS